MSNAVVCDRCGSVCAENKAARIEEKWMFIEGHYDLWLNYSNADDFPNAVKIDDRPVTMGDVYQDGKFYRDGSEVLTPLEDAQKKNAEYEKALSEIEAALGVSM